ncbi:PEP-CTERM sorting domain-containing protein [Akkermansiaceae bacterium]|nr:PEP-CTERM sorting domain-containing protein [Akkermansiaceae bacterium]
MKNTKFGPSLIALFGMTITGHSATISWESSVQMFQGSTTESFVSTTGTTAVAINGSDDVANGNVTVNGVAFTQTIQNNLITGPGATVIVNGGNLAGTAFGDGEFNSNAAIFHMIRGAIYNTTSVEFGGLTVGNDYQIQLFVNDARGNRSVNFIVGVGDGTGSGTAAASLLLNNSPADGSAPTLPQTDAGDSIIGTFTADATTQSFDVYGTNSGDVANLATGDSRAHVNALQLRDLGSAAIPEPSSALLALVGLAFGLRRRR